MTHKNPKRRNNHFLKEFNEIWRKIEKTSIISRIKKQNGERTKQIRYNICLYLRSQALTHFFGLEDKTFRRALDKALRSRHTNKVFFLDILGAHAWANPRFHSYLYEQIPAYVRRNYNGKWNLRIEDDLIKDKIEERLAKWVDIDDVMPDYDSGDTIDLHIVRILSWSDKDMKSDVAQDLIHLHKVFNIPLLYMPPRVLGILLPGKKVEFHLAIDEHGNRCPDGCWIYEERKERKPYRKGMLQSEPEDIIQRILGHDDCVFAIEKRRK